MSIISVVLDDGSIRSGGTLAETISGSITFGSP